MTGHSPWRDIKHKTAARKKREQREAWALYALVILGYTLAIYMVARG